MITAQENKTLPPKRLSGILLHPTSFPSPFGIGDLGQGAYEFIDYLEKCGQTLWQVLPLGPTGYGDSPYQAFSSFAGQPLAISPQKLYDLNLLTDADICDIPRWDPLKIDYGPAIIYKFSLLQKAYSRFKELNSQDLKDEFNSFCKSEETWLLDYALFMAIKDDHGGVVWNEWDAEIAFPTPAIRLKWQKKLNDAVTYYQFIQFLFFKQWLALKNYANQRGISIIGDIPIFVAYDSADVWGNRELYQLDEKGFPIVVAGVPPDYFSATGQLWGNPLYDWKKHKETGYTWWAKRIESTLKIVDILRIDHFRGFEAYWAVPYGSKTAMNGEWLKGPFKDLFYSLQKSLGEDLPIIAEDLGIITPEVEDLRDTFKFPGMKILQFGFENVEENDFLPHNYIINCVCYSGTHDNDTSLGWYKTASPLSQDRVRRYMNTDANDVSWDFVRACFGSPARMAVVPIQDILSLDCSGRMNTPGVAEDNWQWRYTKDMLTPCIAERLLSLSQLFGRGLPQKEK